MSSITAVATKSGIFLVDFLIKTFTEPHADSVLALVGGPLEKAINRARYFANRTSIDPL